MNRKILQMLLLVGVLTLLVSACDSQAFQAAQVEEMIGDMTPDDIPDLEGRDALLDGVNLGGPVLSEDGQTPVEGGPDPGTEMVPASGETRDDVLDRVNQGGSVLSDNGESVLAGQPVAPVEESISEVPPSEGLSPEERDALLDRVNMGGPVLSDEDQSPVEGGPEPGTETILASGETRDDVLDRVNRGGPVLPGSEGTIGEGREPGTESVVGAESISNPAEVAGVQPWTQFLERLRNWLQDILDL